MEGWRTRVKGDDGHHVGLDRRLPSHGRVMDTQVDTQVDTCSRLPELDFGQMPPSVLGQVGVLLCRGSTLWTGHVSILAGCLLRRLV